MMRHDDRFIEVIQARARERTGTNAIIARTSAGDVSWTQLFSHAQNIANHLSASGVRPATAVLLATGTSVEFLVGYCAIKLAGAIAVVVDPRDDEQVATASKATNPVVALTTAASGVALPSLCISVGHDLGITPQSVDPTTTVATHASDICHILFTSGSTGKPKGIVWSETRVLRQAECWTHKRWGNAGGDCMGLVLPLSYGAGFHSALRTLYTGVPLAFVDSPLLIARALQSMDELGVTTFCCTPSFVNLLLDANLPLPDRIERVQIGGAPISTETINRLATLAPHTRVRKLYGLAEVGGVARLRTRELATKAHTVGRPVIRYDQERGGEGKILVCDEQGDGLPRGQTGEIVLDLGPAHTASDGYFRPTPEQKTRFSGGRLWTRDLGYLDEDGYLILVDRSASLLKIGGRLVSTTDLENKLGTLPNGENFAIAKMPERKMGEASCMFYVPVAESSVQQLLLCATNRLLPDAVPRLFLARRNLPRSGSGKLRRGVLNDEATRWRALWPATLAVEDKLCPARQPTLPGELVAIDGLPEGTWPTSQTLLSCARPLGWMTKNNPRRCLARAQVQDGVDQATSGIRIVWGPLIDDDASDAAASIVGDLINAAIVLPGPPHRAVIFAGAAPHAAAALEAAGFERLSSATWVHADDKSPDVVKLAHRLETDCSILGVRPA